MVLQLLFGVIELESLGEAARGACGKIEIADQIAVRPPQPGLVAAQCQYVEQVTSDNRPQRFDVERVCHVHEGLEGPGQPERLHSAGGQE